MHVRSTCAFSWHACIHARTHSSAHTGSPGALARALAHCTAHMHVRTRTRDIPHVRTPYSADPSCKDRWGGTPMDDCARGGTMRCVCACVCVCVCVCVFVCVCVLRAPEDAEHECSGLAQQARADKEPVFQSKLARELAPYLYSLLRAAHISDGSADAQDRINQSTYKYATEYL